MRRTVLSLLALAGTAVLMGTGPAFADGATAPSPVPSAAPTTHPEATDTPRPAAPAERSRTAPSAEPTRAPARDQVSVVPSGAPDTGETPGSAHSGGDATAIGAGAAAVLLVGGGTVFAVRRRASGA
ncbi:sortase-dependent protein [Streptomyces sp. NPDC057794]|uniref:sortase-dependent protein n=1 Tax=Streptomyces sp. NPDC057794 TaxID=3346251 RepID=UPI0036928C01